MYLCVYDINFIVGFHSNILFHVFLQKREKYINIKNNETPKNYISYLIYMQSFKQTFNNLVSEKPSQLILGIIFVIYILLNIQTPVMFAPAIDTIYGKVIVAAIAIVVFFKTNPVIGVLGFVVAYQIIKTADVATGGYGMRHFLPSEQHREQEMKSFNVVAPTSEVIPDSISTSAGGMVVSATLEEEMVDKMAPLVRHGDTSNQTYKPILDGQHGASSLA